ncbi:hypothetical protein [Mesorhizobium sp. YR577]|uniref:DUF6894 family protein n=1 Tax=Mesorhizobium sp. YR577 TaxID=1884373 RepID=UPI000B84272D|nr:hypothetical protein [Mesorhizobium sp. YR577]
MRYFFDVRSDGSLAIDSIGLELVDLKAAAVEAASVLAEKADDMFSGVLQKELSVEIRDAFGTVAMTVTLILRNKSPLMPFRRL